MSTRTGCARSGTALLAGIVGAIVGWGPAPAGAAAPERTVVVRCDRGDSIGAALEANPAGRRLIVEVAGVCREAVTITRDDVTLRGDEATGGVLEGDPARDTLVVDGARRVTVEALTFVGGRSGLVASDGATVTLRRTLLQGHAAGSSAVLARRGSHVVLEESLVSENAGNGITAADGSSATLLGSRVLNNPGGGPPPTGQGVVALRGGVVSLAGGNQITGNSIGVFARDGHVRTGEGLVLANDEISGNQVGISATDNSVLDLRGPAGGEPRTLVTGNAGNGIVVQMGTVLRLRSIEISGNGGHGIFALYDAGVGFFVPAPNYVTVTGNAGSGLYCLDQETSVTGDVRGVEDNGQPGPDDEVICTGFDPPRPEE